MTDDEDLTRIRAALAPEKSAIMALPGVQGVGIGGRPGGYKIVVYVASSKMPDGPQSLQGFPVEYVTTGRIRLS